MMLRGLLLKKRVVSKSMPRHWARKTKFLQLKIPRIGANPHAGSPCK